MLALLHMTAVVAAVANQIANSQSSILRKAKTAWSLPWTHQTEAFYDSYTNKAVPKTACLQYTTCTPQKALTHPPHGLPTLHWRMVHTSDPSRPWHDWRLRELPLCRKGQWCLRMTFWWPSVSEWETECVWRRKVCDLAEKTSYYLPFSSNYISPVFLSSFLNNDIFLANSTIFWIMFKHTSPHKQNEVQNWSLSVWVFWDQSVISLNKSIRSSSCAYLLLLTTQFFAL